VKYFDWDDAKNAKLRAERGIGFEDVVFHIERGDRSKRHEPRLASKLLLILDQMATGGALVTVERVVKYAGARNVPWSVRSGDDDCGKLVVAVGLRRRRCHDAR
jgi:hypothetical protein